MKLPKKLAAVPDDVFYLSVEISTWKSNKLKIPILSFFENQNKTCYKSRTMWIELQGDNIKEGIDMIQVPFLRLSEI